ncbi:hypothetical protein PoB_007693100 [Plakobranchus ocellatus]|uniref:Uncharacterized protein n=1 Tax=Plakobranchus ocellatus TaxID=259542 RepID=A0AAV4E3B1_9GAST|nr:hypothetical protein PoB_007693100 [Plakobranchus ocellatus]
MLEKGARLEKEGMQRKKIGFSFGFLLVFFFLITSPQQGDLRLAGPPLGQGASDVLESTTDFPNRSQGGLAIHGPPTPQKKKKKKKKIREIKIEEDKRI